MLRLMNRAAGVKHQPLQRRRENTPPCVAADDLSFAAQRYCSFEGAKSAAYWCVLEQRLLGFLQ